jgi:hypothetical protein
MDAFVAAQTLLNDFEARLRIALLTANEPFLFYTGVGKDFYTGRMAWSLKGFVKALKEVDPKAIEFHVDNGDFESWAQSSLKDKKLASQIRTIVALGEKGEKLRKAMVDAAKKRYITQSKEVQDATQLF